MTTCPNCGRTITANDEICPNCHFNLQKYRQTFFVKQNEVEQETQKNDQVSRKACWQEFYPEKQNTIIARMLTWIRVNSMIVFLVGILLLILMSFSRGLGWLSFFLLIIWLYFVCLRQDKIERYTVDRRLTEKVNHWGSHMFNQIEEHSERVQKTHAQVEPTSQAEQSATAPMTKKKHFGYLNLSILMMALISLVVLFTGSGAEVSDIAYAGKLSISRMVLSLAGQLFSSGSTVLQGILLCIFWALLIIFPLLIIYQTLQNTHQSQIWSFVLSLIETIFLIYLVFRLSSSARANTGVLHSLTSQLIMYAVSVGASTYFLILSSVMTTGLTAFNLFRKHS
ncbi:zinc ribbon domain-containing protein [Lactobacillus sp. ESL0785]|uniref:zinc ribbon domain-containing protein n=1 Tax=Lactobacillus sp. ESL0785 TaxID=2983232 RepID=UPI0023F7BA3E|nr:zinc ribbon domain-containing protein [Lactobacillus sp. ESL0785]WEV71153.1 zinc ribbon domain-containing protein [Lactobacillus sp. ESL0785]